MKFIFLILILLGSKVGRAESAGSEDTLRFLFSAGGGSRFDGSAYALHLRVQGDWTTEYDDYGFGAGLEFARTNLFESREPNQYFYGFDYLLGLRLTRSIRSSDAYTTRLVLFGGPTRVTYRPGVLATVHDWNPPSVDHSRQGQYAGLGLHFQREHPSLIRLSEWGLTLTLYRTRFPTGWFREGANQTAESPGLMQILLLTVHVGIGGIIDL